MVALFVSSEECGPQKLGEALVIQSLLLRALLFLKCSYKGNAVKVEQIITRTGVVNGR